MQPRVLDPNEVMALTDGLDLYPEFVRVFWNSTEGMSDRTMNEVCDIWHVGLRRVMRDSLDAAAGSRGELSLEQLEADVTAIQRALTEMQHREPPFRYRYA